jgi:two-component system, LytTR family, response regulator
MNYLLRSEPLVEAKNLFKEVGKIILRTTESIFIVSINEIIRCEAKGNYTQFFLSDKRKIMVSKTLKEYENFLTKYGFFRLHNSHLININFIERLDKKEGGVIIMKDKSALPVSVRRKDALLKLLEIL